MTVISTEKYLTPAVKAGLIRLFQICQTKDAYCPSYPEDGDVFFFLREKEQDSDFAAAFILFHLEEDLWEVTALTHPAFRQKGCFRQLLDAAEESFPNADFVFAVPPKAEPAASVLKAIGAHYWYAEHVMAMDAPDFLTPSGETVSPSCQIQWPDGCRTSPGDDISACFYDNQTLTASCRLNFSAGTEGSACCIYQVLVPEVLRNRGWGFRFLTALISCLIQKKVRHFLLQVSGDNLPAMALYKKTGFRITETLWYYLY